MTKQIYISLIVLFGTLLNSCGSTNNQNINNQKLPVITLKGEQSIVIKQGSTYKEVKATAKDFYNEDITGEIKIISSGIDTSKTGYYPIEYRVTDKEGRTASVTRDIYVVSTDFDMEESKGWKLTYNHNNSTIRYAEDEERGRIAMLNGINAIKNQGKYQFQLGEESNYKHKGSILQWSMKTKNDFFVEIFVETKNGLRHLRYTNKDSSEGISTGYLGQWKNITHGIGSNTVDDKWHTLVRDLKSDVKRYEPDNEFKYMKGFYFHGIASFDDVILYNTDKKLAITKTPEISAPGIVLTFDDSYVEGWYSMDKYFRQNGVVATWFCHRWGKNKHSVLTWDGTSIPALNQDEIAKLEKLKLHGDEIALHTINHVDTRDKKYNTVNYPTLEAKAQGYIDDQINPGIQRMRENDFDPKSFSYPFLSGQATHNKMIRKVLPHIREFFGRVMEIDSGGSGVKSAKIADVKAYMDRLKKDKEIGVFVGHWIEEIKTHNFSMTKNDLKEIIQYAKKIGLKFYTLKEAHNIYAHQ